jgi:hypothetical protein
VHAVGTLAIGCLPFGSIGCLPSGLGRRMSAMPTKDEPRLTLRLSADTDRLLREKAGVEGVRPSTWARRALEAALSGSPAVVAPADRKSRGGSASSEARSEPASPRAPDQSKKETQKSVKDELKEIAESWKTTRRTSW